MNENDIEFIQILNIIKRGQRLVIQAKSAGLDTTKAEELINEAKYALRIGNRESAIDYAKKCMLVIIQDKREQDKVALSQDGALEKLTKVELRRKAQELGLDPVGLKEELIARIKASISQAAADAKKASEEKAAIEKGASEEKARKEKASEAKTMAEETRLAEQVEAALKKEERPSTQPKEFNADVEAAKMITGLSYLVEEQRADKIYHLFNALKKADKIGFAISRTNPKLIQRTYNTFNPVIRFLRRLVDKISTTQCILLVSLAPETLDQSQVTLLEKDLYPLNYS